MSLQLALGLKFWCRGYHSPTINHPGTAVTPGPGAHSPERVNVHKPAAPRFSMGVRHSEYVTPLIVEID